MLCAICSMLCAAIRAVGRLWYLARQALMQTQTGRQEPAVVHDSIIASIMLLSPSPFLQARSRHGLGFTVILILTPAIFASHLKPSRLCCSTKPKPTASSRPTRANRRRPGVDLEDPAVAPRSPQFTGRRSLYQPVQHSSTKSSSSSVLLFTRG